MDFAQHCIANAITGPVMLTAHLENDKKLLDTVSIFDRDVAYPLACGENYLDPCVARLDREGDGEVSSPGAGPDAFLQTKYAAATARAALGSRYLAQTPRRNPTTAASAVTRVPRVI